MSSAHRMVEALHCVRGERLNSLSRKPRSGPAWQEKLRCCEQRWDYCQSKKIRPCLQKTERLSAVLGSAVTGNPPRANSDAIPLCPELSICLVLSWTGVRSLTYVIKLV